MSRPPRGVARAQRKGRGLPTRKTARRGGILALALAVAALLATTFAYYGPGPDAAGGDKTTVYLQRGSSLTQIADALDDAKVINSRVLFVLVAKLGGASASLKAGEYEFASGASMAKVLDDIHEGRVVRHVVTAPEGITSQMVVERLMAETALTGPVGTPPEGAVLPQTYDFHRGESRAAVLQRMIDAQDKLLAQLWANRAPGLPFRTPQEAVTLASIVEKETALASERPRIAAVFLNRIRVGMRLESDPTIIYGLTKGKPLGRRILLSELKGATPYNTYVIDGLPPTPIANPGEASLRAVLNPPRSDELFFVADGTGGHVFARTFDEHLRNVARWRRIEAQTKAKEAP